MERLDYTSGENARNIMLCKLYKYKLNICVAKTNFTYELASDSNSNRRVKEI